MMLYRLSLLYLAVTWTVAGDKIDQILPGLLKRVSQVRKVLVPLPKYVLDETLYNAAAYYIPVDSESEICRNHSSLLFDAFLEFESWALKFVDASSKLSPGILDGNFMDLGSYDQCLSLTAPNNIFKGQHCVVETRGLLPTDMDTFNPKRPILPTLRVDLMFSVCVPSSCSVRDIQVHMDVALNSVEANSIMYNSSCSSNQPLPFTELDFVAFGVLGLILFLVLLGTLSDTQEHKRSELKYIRSFSLVLNTRDLLDTDIPTDNIPCLHGLRVITLAWLMLGYRMIHLLASPNFRFKYLTENIDNILWAPIENAHLAVEIYFLVTGVVVTYCFCQRRRDGKRFSYFKFLFYHYIRLTVPIALMTLLYASILIHVTDGPIWKRLFQFQQEFCQKNWWANLLYISNYVSPYEMCIPQTWYLAIEFQLYALSPILLLPLYKQPRRGYLLIAIVFLMTVIGGLINSYWLGIQAGGLIRIDRTREGTNVLDYFHTQYRAASFLIGIVLGYNLHKLVEGELAFNISKFWLGWIVSSILVVASVCSVSIFQNPDYVYTPWLDSLYGILHRPALSLGVSWIILMCTVGGGGFINSILSWKALVPLSRLTYCSFLVHFLIQDVQAFSTRTPVTTDFLNLWFMFCADFVLSYTFAAILHLTVEAPVCNLIRLVFKERGPSGDYQEGLRPSRSLPSFQLTELKAPAYNRPPASGSLEDIIIAHLISQEKEKKNSSSQSLTCPLSSRAR